jgi:hypothetical protein
MKEFDEFTKAALHSQLDHLKGEADALLYSSGVKHHEALDRVAASYGFRDWQNLVHETELAEEARLHRSADLKSPEDDLLCEKDLHFLCHEYPKAALLAIEELAITLVKDLLDTLRSPSLFAKRAADFGDNLPHMDDKNYPGWWLDVNKPKGYLFQGQYPANGKMIALIDGSVPGWLVGEYLRDCPGVDEEEAVAELREQNRDNGNIYLYGQGEVGRDDNVLKIAEACYQVVLDSVEEQCGVTLT